MLLNVKGIKGNIRGYSLKYHYLAATLLNLCFFLFYLLVLPITRENSYNKSAKVNPSSILSETTVFCFASSFPLS